MKETLLTNEKKCPLKFTLWNNQPSFFVSYFCWLLSDYLGFQMFSIETHLPGFMRFFHPRGFLDVRLCGVDATRLEGNKRRG